MRRFARLFAELDRTNKTNEKVAALEDYFREAPPADAAWATFLLSGRKVRQIIPVRKLCEWAAEVSLIPDWLFSECYETVGDLAETVSLILPPTQNQDDAPLAVWMDERLLPLREAEEKEQQAALRRYWSELGDQERFVLHKLLTGAFRVGVSQKLVTRSLANVCGLDVDVVAHRLMGDWTPNASFFVSLQDADESDALPSKPYPFFLAHPLGTSSETLGDIANWLAEWKWDGIRAQLIRRGGETFIWSRGEELMSDRFPELLESANALPDGVVLDGEILAWKNGVLPFAVMQKRIGRKKLGKRILNEAPVAMIVFDLLEQQGKDIRAQPLRTRRSLLTQLLNGLPEGSSLRVSPPVRSDSWDSLSYARQTSRQHRTEGLMLKRLDSPYRAGRPRGIGGSGKSNPILSTPC